MMIIIILRIYNINHFMKFHPIIFSLYFQNFYINNEYHKIHLILILVFFRVFLMITGISVPVFSHILLNNPVYHHVN
jgi:hypothetical protein